MPRIFRALSAGLCAALIGAGGASAAPTAQCLWTALSPEDRGSFSQIVQAGSPLSEDLHDVLVADVRACGFEAGVNGERRAGFLIAMMVYRTQAELALSAAGGVSAAQLEAAWAGLDTTFRSQMIAFARERYFRRAGQAPDAASLDALAVQLHLSGPGPRAQLQTWLLVRATIDYIEQVGAAFEPPPPAAS